MFIYYDHSIIDTDGESNHQYYYKCWINDMNTKNNQRARNTDETIVRAVFGIMVDENKPVNRITVREVCERSEINRSTFYAHYLDVYDVVEQVEHTMAEGLTKSFLRKLEEGQDLGSCFEALFGFVREHRQFYRLYFQTSGRSGVIGIAWELLRDRMQALSYESFGYRSEEEMKYHGEFFIYGLSAMLRRWIDRDCRETPGELLDMLARQYDPDMSLFAWDRTD